MSCQSTRCTELVYRDLTQKSNPWGVSDIVTCIPNTVHSQRWAGEHVGLVVAVLERDQALAHLITNQGGAGEASLLTGVSVHGDTMFCVLNEEASDGRVVRDLLTCDIGLARTLHIAPVSKVLLTQDRVVRFLLPFAFGHTARVRCVQRRNVPLDKGHHALQFIIRLRDGGEQLRLLSPVFTR